MERHFERLSAGGIQGNAVHGQFSGRCFGFDGGEIGDAVFGGESGRGLAARDAKEKYQQHALDLSAG
jgi:hypothetical protein